MTQCSTRCASNR